MFSSGQVNESLINNQKGWKTKLADAETAAVEKDKKLEVSGTSLCVSCAHMRACV